MNITPLEVNRALVNIISMETREGLENYFMEVWQGSGEESLWTPPGEREREAEGGGFLDDISQSQ